MSLQRCVMLSVFMLMFFASSSAAGGAHSHAPVGVHSHAPIGVMADHGHKKGEWMVSYRFMNMDMPVNYSGSKTLDVGEVLNDYMISPISMTMRMHMLGAMYGVSDELTAMVMLPYVAKTMGHRRRSDGRQFTTESSGLGDIRLSGLFSIKDRTGLPVHLDFGVSFPTGGIDETDATLSGPGQDLPYPMQLGSGTYAVLPGVTYADSAGAVSWGFQETSAFQLGKNHRKYQLGDFHEMTAWVAYAWREWMSTSLRVKGSIWGDITGADPRLTPTKVPTADPDRKAGERVELFIGANLLGHHGNFKNHRLALEVGYPVYQHLDGPQLGFGVQGTVGWQYAF